MCGCEQLIHAADKAAAVFRGGPLMQSQSVEAEKPVMARRVRDASICFPGGRAVGFGSLRNEPYPPSQAGKLTKSQGKRCRASLAAAVHNSVVAPSLGL